MKDSQSKAILLRDYKAPNFLIDETVLKFDLKVFYLVYRMRLRIKGFRLVPVFFHMIDGTYRPIALSRLSSSLPGRKKI